MCNRWTNFTFPMTYPCCYFPDGLHGQGDEAGDGVGHGQVEYQVVHIGSAPENCGNLSKAIPSILLIQGV